MNGPVVMVNVNADKFAEPTRPAQLSEVGDESRRISSKSDNSPVDIYDECVISIDLSTGRKANI